MVGAAATLGLVAGIPADALACAVCYGQRNASDTGYLVATALMLGLPLLLVGGVTFWLRHATRRLSAAARPRAASPTPRSGALRTAPRDHGTCA